MFLGSGRAGFAAALVIAAGLGILPFLGAPARAAEDLFSVTGVAVDETAETAAKAREAAIAAGQRKALDRLLRRLTPRADYGRLPVLDDTEVTALVRGFEIEEEKTSPTRYLAKLTIRFKKNGVRDLLRQSAIPFTETVSKPILVLPVYEFAGTRLLWDDPNPWRQAWAEQRPRDTLVPLIVPRGDLGDVAAISEAQALAGDDDRLAAIAGRYGVDDVLVAHAATTIELGTGVPRLRVVLQRYGRDDERTFVESFSGSSRGEIEPLLAEAVRRIVARLEEDWKRETQLQFDSPEQLSASVPVADLGEWLEIRRRLATVAEVRRTEIASLTRRDIQLVLHYLGEPIQLVTALAQRDLDLTEEGGYWTLRLRTSPETSAATPATAR